MEETLDRPIHFTGAMALFITIFGNLLKYLTYIEVNDVLLTITSALGIVFLIYKILAIRIEYKERLEIWRKRQKRRK